MNEFERFMAERFPDSIDRRRCLNGDGSDYMSWDMNVARVVWNHLQQKLDAVTAENVALKCFIESRCWVYDAAVEGYRDAVGYLPETPATDAILNAMRAEGAKEVANRIRACTEEFPQQSSDIVEECACIADEYAAQLRNGEAVAKDGE